MKKLLLLFMVMLTSFSSTTFAEEMRSLPLGFTDISPNLSVVNYEYASLPLTSVKTPTGYTELTPSGLVQSPNAVISMSPQQGITTSTSVTWGSSNSKSPNGTITQVEWKVNGTVVATPPSLFTKGGVYTVTLRVQNSSGVWSNYASQTFTVPNPPVNGVPLTFTPAGASGAYGPTQAQINTAYNGTALNGKVTLSNKMQQWVVPLTGVYTIDAYGAQGGTNDSTKAIGGKGARIKGDLSLTAGQVIDIRVGQQGYRSGGGGGSFVWIDDQSTPLIVAGGGGGSGKGNDGIRDYYGNGGSGLATNNGGNGEGNYGLGGKNGNAGTPGGTWYANNGTNGSGGGGAGWYQDAPGNYTTGSPARMRGGDGGVGYVAVGASTSGFGGGNDGWSGAAGGGGGGYSGGGGGNWSNALGSGGGGSYNAGTSQLNSSGFNEGNGKVIIKQIE
jgi:hypothetical protein